MRPEVGCGGADKWTVVPDWAFPGYWWTYGRGNLFCDAGHYCPNTTAQIPCPRGYYCKTGSTKPTKCPPLMTCPEKSEVPSDNYAGMVLDLAMFVGLWVVWMLYRWYHRLLRKLSKKQRLKMNGEDYHAPKHIFGHASQEMSQAVSAEAAAGEAAETASGDGEQQVSGQGQEENGDVLSIGAMSRTQSAELQDGGDEERQGRRRSNSGALARIIKSISPQKTNRHSPSKQGSVHVPVWASFGGPAPGSADYCPLMGQPPTHPADPSQAGAILTSPRMSSPGPQEAARPMLDVEFTNMGMRLKGTGRKVLAGVTGRLRESRMTAIMGPSGAGKTSLMAALAGKASYGTVSGSVKVNGKADKLLRYKRVMGFVPQDDIMYTNLTVEENLLFSAQYRLPVHYTHAQHVYYVERAIQILALDDIRNEIIGDEEVRGISGGQRKRVNVGLELVADPIMLFLDEPTSGLDSTSSKMVISALQQVAHMGVTIAAVIHQPSYEIFQMFDDILLLAKGGRTAFYGPEGQVQGYFEKLGYALPQRTNPADVYMDIIAGIKSRVDGPPQTPQDLAAAWDDHNLPPDQPPTPRPLPDSDTDSDSGQADSSLSGFGPAELAEYSIPLPGTPMTPAVGPMHNKAGQWLRRKWKKGLLVGAYLGKELREQMAAFRCQLTSRVPHKWKPAFLRSDQPQHVEADLLSRQGSRASLLSREGSMASQMLQDRAISSRASRSGQAPKRSKRPTPGFRRQFVWCLSRVALQRTREPLIVVTDYAIFALTGLALGSITDRGRGNIMRFDVDTLYNNVALGLLTTVSALRTFGVHRVVFYREAASGLNKFAFFLAQDTFDHTGTLLKSLLYMVMYYSFAQPRAVIWQMYLCTVAIVYACTGTAYLMSQVMEPASAQLAAAIYSLIAALLGRRHDGPLLLWCIYNLSFARWGLEGRFHDSQQAASSLDVQQVAAFQGMTNDVFRCDDECCCKCQVMYGRCVLWHVTHQPAARYCSFWSQWLQKKNTADCSQVS
ncbi:TPA: hypothetical protein ACH3X2_003675 [Trebouxia sp. C0005]